MFVLNVMINLHLNKNLNVLSVDLIIMQFHLILKIMINLKLIKYKIVFQLEDFLLNLDLFNKCLEEMYMIKLEIFKNTLNQKKNIKKNDISNLKTNK